MREAIMITAEPAHPLASIVIGLLSFVLLCLLAVMIGTTPPAGHLPAVPAVDTIAAQTVPVPVPHISY